MCHVFSRIDSARYASITRSVRLAGHATSIRLEASFWTILEEIAAAQHISLGRLLTQLHDEVLEFSGEANNFASLLRCACLTYVADVRGDADATRKLRAQATHDLGRFVESPQQTVA